MIADNIKKIPRDTSREKLIDEINRINSQIRGVIQYYQCCTWVSVSMDKYGRKIQLAASCRLKQYKGKWIRAERYAEPSPQYTRITGKRYLLSNTVTSMLELHRSRSVTGRKREGKIQKKRPRPPKDGKSISGALRRSAYKPDWMMCIQKMRQSLS